MSRGRAWRRAKSATKEAQQDRLAAIRIERRPGRDAWKMAAPEKNWKKMSIRSNKLARAKQLGFDYPRTTARQALADHDTHDT